MRSVEDKMGEQMGEESPSLRSSFSACSLREKVEKRTENKTGKSVHEVIIFSNA